MIASAHMGFVTSTRKSMNVNSMDGGGSTRIISGTAMCKPNNLCGHSIDLIISCSFWSQEKSFSILEYCLVQGLIDKGIQFIAEAVLDLLIEQPNIAIVSLFNHKFSFAGRAVHV